MKELKIKKIAEKNRMEIALVLLFACLIAILSYLAFVNAFSTVPSLDNPNVYLRPDKTFLAIDYGKDKCNLNNLVSYHLNEVRESNCNSAFVKHYNGYGAVDKKTYYLKLDNRGYWFDVDFGLDQSGRVNQVIPPGPESSSYARDNYERYTQAKDSVSGNDFTTDFSFSGDKVEIKLNELTADYSLFLGDALNPNLPYEINLLNSRFIESYSNPGFTSASQECVSSLDGPIECGKPPQITFYLGLPLVEETDIFKNIYENTLAGIRLQKTIIKSDDPTKKKLEVHYSYDELNNPESIKMFREGETAPMVSIKQYFLTDGSLISAVLDDEEGGHEAFININPGSDPYESNFVNVKDAAAFGINVLAPNQLALNIPALGRQCADGNLADGDGCTKNGEIEKICELAGYPSISASRSERLTKDTNKDKIITDLANRLKADAKYPDFMEGDYAGDFDGVWQCPPSPLWKGMQCQKSIDIALMNAYYPESEECKDAEPEINKFTIPFNGNLKDTLARAATIMTPYLNNFDCSPCGQDYQSKLNLGISKIAVADGQQNYDFMFELSCVKVKSDVMYADSDLYGEKSCSQIED
ncbi:hypothetical protein J4217_04720 [Candidatus Pacearchaeota archaeon]|nr:hypothetical protein [Candidatus Pacearchaeota archaeon]